MRGDSRLGLIWGFDAGLGILTYRMTSGVWVGLVLAATGVVSPATLISYGGSFGIAIVVVALWPARRGASSRPDETALRRVERLTVGRTRARAAYVGCLAVSIVLVAIGP